MSRKIDYNAIAQDIIRKLNWHNLGAYLWKEERWGSCYIRFNDPYLPTIMVGRNGLMERYNFKYSIRKDIQNIRKEKHGDTWRHYYPLDAVDALVAEVVSMTKLKMKLK